ncbi:MAG: type I-C CRISPR-associated protein Cas5 [Myxococcales bacterium]|nr:type I-C CRISPR-associated protein Cas5 [Myxococcales bacterium]
MTSFTPVRVKVWGEYACFTRPEMKVERVSYDVMTPSAARGVLEAIFWKPEFEWQISSIHVLNPLKRFSLVRNEINTLASKSAASSWEKDGRGGFFADQDRTQRHSLVLRDVAYLIEADVMPYQQEHGLFAKFRDQFRRRVAKGQCLRQPYLGCREFTAHFAEPDGTEQALPFSMELGRMLFDMRYVREGKKQGEATPVFFKAALEQGVLKVPTSLYEETRVPPPKREARRYLDDESAV